MNEYEDSASNIGAFFSRRNDAIEASKGRTLNAWRKHKWESRNGSTAIHCPLCGCCKDWGFEYASVQQIESNLIDRQRLLTDRPGYCHLPTCGQMWHVNGVTSTVTAINYDHGCFQVRAGDGEWHLFGAGYPFDWIAAIWRSCWSKRRDSFVD